MLTRLAAASRRPWLGDAAALLSLGAMAVFYVAISWRTWADPLVDAGAQLYAPWRLAGGEVLFRDIEWPYGPLSAYLNALLFKAFGPGIMVLVAANLAVHSLIVLASYAAIRTAWGRLGAWAACAVFVGVFSFSRLTGTANYTYALPYSHEATHGRVLTIALLLVAARWSQRRSRALAATAGLCAGLTVVLKPEFILAAALMAAATVVFRHFNRCPMGRDELALAAGTAVLPVLGFALWFHQWMGWDAALVGANNAWWAAVVDHTQSTTALQSGYFGLDHARANAGVHLRVAAYTLGVVALLRGGGWALENRDLPATLRVTAVGAAVGAVVAAVLAAKWIDVGRCLPGVLAFLFAASVLRLARDWRASRALGPASCTAMLLVLMAAALLTRMSLNARIYHFGFVQASPAAMAFAAYLVWLPPREPDTPRIGRAFAACGGLILLAAATVSVTGASRWMTSHLTEWVGSGRDRFLAFDLSVDPTAELVRQVSRHLQADGGGGSVLVLPEGLMINYLTRRPTPLPTWSFAFGTTAAAAARERPLVDRLERDPPAFVVIISRYQGADSAARYGGTEGAGSLLLPWLARRYVVDASWGGDPLDADGGGAVVLRRLPPAELARAPGAP